ncbi:enoyl-ACP reductase FabI [Hydrogenophaga sp.]|uniref:enoyl-ACP reductase FabI n=1 Tax=Hydrogenophaga sp. TaxID=1904254 RepID=UPI0025C2AAD9|nr:enoyl-ACP reductase FabI [Hydrogenophaga sp.]
MNDRKPSGLSGKKGLILGLANEHSIAWGCVKNAREQGADLVAVCLNDKARTYVEPLTNPLDITLLNCDVEDDGALEQAVEQAAAQMGRIDFVVHSIAWAPLVDLHGPVVASSRAGFARAMDVSCHSFARLARLCAPHMSAGGSLVTMSYLGADEAVPHYGLMGPVKAALESLVRYMAVELGPQGIRVHAVSPGPIQTRSASGINHFDELMSHAQQKAPRGRLVTLDEIAGLCSFLCSDAATGMTGQTIYVDAGCHAVA